MKKQLPVNVYVSGPISETPNHLKLFREAVDFLKERGHKPLDPLNIKPSKEILSPEQEWVYYMKESVKLLVEADAVYMLDGWEDSRGAKVEHDLAKKLDIPIYYASEDHKYV
jgi:nucleoside 2-deoxyribosyltransferase